MPGYKDWVDGVALPAADMDDYISKQVVNLHTSAAARDAAITSGLKREGMMVMRSDVNTLEVSRDATAGNYSTIGPVHGALLAWAPTLTQSGSVTRTVTFGSYSRVGRQITAHCLLDVTAAGTASNQITVSLPVTAATSLETAIGTGWVQDTSAVSVYQGNARIRSSTTAYLIDQFASPANVYSGAAIIGAGASTMNAALANTDRVSFTICYEASADA